ncbi:hypothetical protein [Microbacterium sp. NPDC058389]|uniref:hypothetical protein n=1 Tax=Microbacterium sp. NPDC058389 TaxID=3346475 RepID=UPI00364C1F38
MKRRLGICAIALLLALTGCASGAATPTPTPTQDPNAQACEDFEAATNSMGDALDADNVATAWDDTRDAFDEIALTAEGTVSDRMLAVVDGWPKVSEILIYGNIDEFNDSLTAVERACAASGTTIKVNQFVKKTG